MDPPLRAPWRAREALREFALRLRDDWGLHGLPRCPRQPSPGERGPRSRAEKESALAELAGEIEACHRCRLAEGRRRAVPGEGDAEARLVFIGEAPGANEDRQGRPFVGPAGELLDAIIERGMGLERAQVFIANIVKCRPPGNRDPQPDEIQACAAFLERQLDIVEPEVIITLGRPASMTILGVDQWMSRMRGRSWEVDGRTIVPTYHPSYLLRRPGEKRRCWEDIQRAMAILGLPPPRGSAGS